MGNVDQKHPLYSEHADDWTQMRDTYKGERAVKKRGFTYLRCTSGMRADGAETGMQSEGYKAYLDYLTRARMPGVVKSAVEMNIGVMHNKPPTIELPAQLEPMRARATLRNESLEMLMRRINEEQLVAGRLGLLLEVVPNAPQAAGEVSPGVGLTIGLYYAEDATNWDDGSGAIDNPDALNMVTLCESGYENLNDKYTWTMVEKYRVLTLGDPREAQPEHMVVGSVPVYEPEAGGKYTVTLHSKAAGTYTISDPIKPSIKGKELERIPFVFVNTKDIVPSPDDPPLLDLSTLALAIYRKEADYNQALFMQGQDTFVVIGGKDDDSYRVGAGAAVKVPIGGDAKYVGVSSQGLPEMRTSLENDYSRAREFSGSLTDETSRQKESGEALKVRIAGKTASLNQIALAGAFGLQELLRIAAVWIGADPSKVIVTPNLDFIDDVMTGADLNEIQAARLAGAPLSERSQHKLMAAKGMTEMTYEEEIKAIEEEESDGRRLPTGTSNPNGPAADEPVAAGAAAQ